MMQGRQSPERGRGREEGEEKRLRPPGNGRVPIVSWWPVQSYDPCLLEGSGQGTWEENPGTVVRRSAVAW